MSPRKTLVIGANGQLGRAVRTELGEFGHIEYAGRDDIDLASPDLVRSRRWRDYGIIVNAAAYTAVDGAETADGRRAAWAVNATGVAALARVAREHDITLVHVSSDYVFDGSLEGPYGEDEPFAPLGVYGQTKAAGDAVVGTVPRHYILRTSWVIGDGKNFVATMRSLAERGIDPRVVDDQTGRLTFTDDLARGIRHLLESAAPFGTYNLTSSGPASTWAQIAARVFELTGHDPSRVSGISTEDYFSSADGPVSPRPRNSVLALEKIEATGFRTTPGDEALARYLAP